MKMAKTGRNSSKVRMSSAVMVPRGTLARRRLGVVVPTYPRSAGQGDIVAVSRGVPPLRFAEIDHLHAHSSTAEFAETVCANVAFDFGHVQSFEGEPSFSSLRT